MKSQIVRVELPIEHNSCDGSSLLHYSMENKHHHRINKHAFLHETHNYISESHSSLSRSCITRFSKNADNS